MIRLFLFHVLGPFGMILGSKPEVSHFDLKQIQLFLAVLIKESALVTMKRWRKRLQLLE
jgi:hypothetical protein